MLTPNDRERLAHMLDAIEKVDQALADYRYPDFAKSWEKRLVIERLFEIIGEAANHLSSDFTTQHPHIPWPQIVGMRNLISHEYFRVDSAIIWATATQAIPGLHQQLQQILSDENDS
jgi:uncharacterized protein with HEPN domain